MTEEMYGMTAFCHSERSEEFLRGSFAVAQDDKIFKDIVVALSTKNTPRIDYKKELESASRSMIMIHDPKLLIKLIVRMIVTKVLIKHAGMILYEPERDSYILNISRGETGFKIPAGYARFDRNHPIIKLFTDKDLKPLTAARNAILVQDLNKLIWQESVLSNNTSGNQELLHNVGTQMQMFNAVACVPAYYHDKLLAVLLLGEKSDGNNFDQQELDFFAALASDAAMAIRNAQLFAALKKESDRNRDLFLRTTLVLGSAIEAKDKYTHGHTQRVTDISVMIARQMNANGTANFSVKFIENLYIASMLHDIGKIGVPESVLNKIETLTNDDFDILRQHPLFGVEILTPLSELKESLDGVRYHHERYDGRGYPEKLKGDQIPLIATIISVADAFDAIITDRPYRKARSKEEAMEEIRTNIAKQFHPLPAQALIELFEQGKL